MDTARIRSRRLFLAIASRVRVGFRSLCFASIALASLLIGSVCNAVEIGIDGGVTVIAIDDDDDQTVKVALPVSDGIRFGFALGNLSVIEVAPSVAFSSLGGFSSTTALVGVSYLRGRFEGRGSAPFGFVGAHTRFADGGGSSQAQVGLSAGGGMRWRTGEVFGLRAKVAVTRWFEGDYPARWDYGALFGLSVFTD